MSVMDRPTAAGKIRALDTPSAEGPIIGVITLNDANADPRNKDHFNDVLIKPVDQTQLAAATDTHISHVILEIPKPSTSPTYQSTAMTRTTR